MKKSDIMGALSDIGGLTIGATASKFVQNKFLGSLTFIPEKFRPVVPVAIGAFLMKQKGIIGNIGRGMIADGGSSLVTSFVPGMAGLSSDDINAVGDKVDTILDNILSGGDELGALDTGLHDDLNGGDELGALDTGLHDDLNGDDDMNGAGDEVSGGDELGELEY